MAKFSGLYTGRNEVRKGDGEGERLRGRGGEVEREREGRGGWGGRMGQERAGGWEEKERGSAT